MHKEIAASAVQGGPGVVVSGLSLVGHHLSDVVTVLTVIWMALSIVNLIVKWNKK